MVSKANEDLPEPDRPVMTVRVFRGISRLMFLRLCCRAPRITSLVRPMRLNAPSTGALAHSEYTEARITLHNSRGNLAGSRNARAARIFRKAFLGIFCVIWVV